MKKITGILFVMLIMIITTTATISEAGWFPAGWFPTNSDENRTYEIGLKLKKNQPTPTDINYSLERYNLIRRAYWVNGQREKAVKLPCAVSKPLGYIVLFAGNATVGSFVVDGKVTSLNSYLTPDSERYQEEYVDWLSDIDGSYGENDKGIFFFTPDGKYIEWTGTYLYTDIPVKTPNAVVTYQVK